MKKFIAFLCLENEIGDTVQQETKYQPRWCVAYLNGQQVNRHHRVRAGDKVEFVFPWGFKGSDKPMSAQELMDWRGLSTEQYSQLLRQGLPSVRGKGQDILHSREAVKQWFSVVPPGAPKWITGNEIEDTLRVWQRYYRQLLTADDALEILINVHNLFDVMFPKVGEGKEAVQ